MMTAENWNTRYATDDYVFGVEPSPFLIACQDRLPASGMALSLADGEGRNGVWLAEQGLDVLALDWSAEGLKKAERLATRRGVRLRTECHDMLTWHWPAGAFDVVCAMNFHFPKDVRETLFARIIDTLAPGGVLVFEGIHKDTRDHHDPDSLYDEPMLRGLCQGLEMLTLSSSKQTRQMDDRSVTKTKLNGLAVKPLAVKP